MHKCTAALIVAAVVLAGSAAQAQAPRTTTRNDCLSLGQVDSFSAIRGNEKAFVVIDKLRRRFRVNLMYRCPGLDFNLAVGFKTVRPHPSHPRLRLELRSTLSWKEDVEMALDRLLGAVQKEPALRPL